MATTRKRTDCEECGKILTGIKSRFCSQTCYIFRKRKRAKEFAQKWRWRFPEKQCEECGKTFKPIREIQFNCSSICGQKNARRKAAAKRAKMKKFPRSHPMRNFYSKKKEEVLPKNTSYVTTAEFNPVDKTKDAVLEFLKKGGKIKKFPESPRAKIPAVSFKYDFGGIENEFTDELMEEYGYIPLSG